MTRAYIQKEKAAPLWAVLGAPLIGVPLMVGLLALASPQEAELPNEPTNEPTIEMTVESDLQEGEPEPLALRC